MAELVVRESERPHGGSGVATTDDAEAVDLGERLRDGLRAGGEAGNSNTPIGPFQNTVFEPETAEANRAAVSGPMSRPMPSVPNDEDSMASAATVSWSASAAKAEATTTSVGRSMVTPSSFARERYSRTTSSWSASSSDFATPWPWAARNVKSMPPPMQRVSTFGRMWSMTPSLSLTFDPPSTTVYGRSGEVVRRSSTRSSVSISEPAALGSADASS